MISYERNGVANLFMFFEPLSGIRYVEVTKTKTRIDFANKMKLLVDKYYCHAKQIRLIMDNYSTHKLKFLYEVFEPAEARRIIKKIRGLEIWEIVEGVTTNPEELVFTAHFFYDRKIEDTLYYISQHEKKNAPKNIPPSPSSSDIIRA